VVTATGTVGGAPRPLVNPGPFRDGAYRATMFIAPKVVAGMQRFKYQALVTPLRGTMTATRASKASAPGRTGWCWRAENSETHRSQVFSALVDGEEDGPLPARQPSGHGHAAGPSATTVSDYLEIGSHFSPLVRARISGGAW